MTQKSDLKNRLSSFFDTGKYHAKQMAEEIRFSANKIRDGIDDQKIRREQNELFRKLGEQAYLLYKDSKEQVPQILHDTINQIDKIAGDIIPRDKIESIGDIVEETIRNVAEDINDFMEDTVKNNQQPKNRSEKDDQEKK